MRKRILSLFLALTMLISLAPAVFAVDTSFADVSESDWFYAPVQWAVENSITSGLSETEFGPNVICTRGQVVTFLWAAANKPDPAVTDNPFVDVTEADWFYLPVLWAVENGITGGMTSDTFGPNEPCTRSQVVTFLWAAANKPEPSVTDSPFADVADADWFFTPVLWAVENGITSGLTPDTFGAYEPCTRGQIVTFLFAASKIGNAEPTPTPEVTPMPEVTPTLTPESGYAVCELEWNDGTVSAVVSAAADCTLAVALLNERGEAVLAETDIPVTAGAVLDTVTAPLQLAQMPDHYQLRAQLLDDNGNALCNPFVNRKHTTVYESFDALTESDFPEDRVLDLVSSNDGNFAVLRDDVIWLAQTDENNVLTSRIDGVCVFTNPDAVLLAVRTGDRIMFRDTDEQYAGVLVESVQLMNDGSLEIREAADTTISDFYSIIKIDVDLEGHAVNENGAVQLAAASSGSGSDSKEENPYWVDVQMGPAVSNSVKTPFGSFGHSTTAGGKLELRFGFEGWDSYVEYTMLVGVKSEIDLLIGPTKSTESPNVPDKNSKDEEDKEKGILEICSITLAGLKDVADIPLTLSVVYDIECEAGLETTLSAEAMIGCVYNSNDGSQLVDYKDVSTGDIELKGSIEIEVGLLASISGELFDGKISAALGAEFGSVINGEARAFIAPLLGTDEYHACDLCIDGKLGAYFDLGIKVEFEISKKLKGDIVDLDLLRVDWEIAKLYGSLFNHAQSVHGGIPAFDWGECPNKKYKITFRTYKNDIEENGHPVSVTSDAWGAQGGEDSVCQLYLYPGKYWAEADIGIQNDRQSFTQLPADHPFAPYVGTYNEPIRPDPET